MTKRIIALVICCISIFSIMLITGCSAENSKTAMDAFEKYAKAQDDVDADTLLALVPEDLKNYIRNKYIESGSAEEKVEKAIKEEFEPLVNRMDFALFYAPDKNFKDAFSFKYEVTGKHEATKDEVKVLNEYVKNKMKFENDIEDVVVMKSKLTVTAQKDGKEFLSGGYRVGFCLKINGEWYYFEETRNTAELWRTADGLDVIDQVEWIAKFIKG